MKTAPHFDGPVYDPKLDHSRLTKQIQRVFACMVDSKWRTLAEIAKHTGDPESSVSAQLRHLRKERFGGHTVNKRRRMPARLGVWEYQLIAKGRRYTDE